MKIGLIAGTVVDTKMGVSLLEKHNYDSIFLPISKNCVEQDKMQYFSKNELQEIFEDTCKKALSEKADKILIYCNSLSSSVNYKSVSKKLNIDIISPLESYISLPSYAKNVVILAANGVSAHTVDKIISTNNKNVKTISIGNLSIVEQIESNKSPKEILDSLNLKGLISYLENIKLDEYKVDSIILTCTHFPYIKSALQEISTLNIIDPSEDILKRLEN